MDMTAYIPHMTPYVPTIPPIVPLLFVMTGMYMFFYARRDADERDDKDYKYHLESKERDIRNLREEIRQLQEKHMVLMREKEEEHHRQVQSFTEHILSLSGNKMRSEEGYQQTTHAFQETFQQTTNTFKDAIEQMKNQHSALMETQGQQIQSLKEEIRVVRNKVGTVEKIMTCAIHFIRNRSAVYREFIESEEYVVKALDCEYPHLSFKKLALPAPAAAAAPASLMPAATPAPAAAPAPVPSALPEPAALPVPDEIKPVKRVVVSRPKLAPS